MHTNLLRHIPEITNPFEFCEFFGHIKPVTVEKYKNDLKLFSLWLRDHKLPDDLPLAPDVVKRWLEDLSQQGLKANTVKRRKAAIGFLHTINNLNEQNPVHHISLKGFIKQVQKFRSLQGLSNRLAQKDPLTADQIRKLYRCCSKKTLVGLRNRALLLVGFSTALRRSELCNLQWSDIQFHDQTMTVIVRHSKTDTYSEGQSLTVSKGTKYHCPIRALKDWQQASGITTGYIFRAMSKLRTNQPISGQCYAKLIKTLCKQIGLDPVRYSGHSTRRGMLVTASNQGANLHILKSHARHQNSQMTEHYIGDAISNRNNPTKNLYRYQAN